MDVEPNPEHWCVKSDAEGVTVTIPPGHVFRTRLEWAAFLEAFAASWQRHRKVHSDGAWCDALREAKGLAPLDRNGPH